MFKNISILQTATFFFFLSKKKYVFFIHCILTIFLLKLHQGDKVTSPLTGLVKLWVGTPDVFRPILFALFGTNPNHTTVRRSNDFSRLKKEGKM